MNLAALLHLIVTLRQKWIYLNTGCANKERIFLLCWYCCPSIHYITHEPFDPTGCRQALKVLNIDESVLGK